MNKDIIKYDEENDEYSIIYEGIKFSWEEKPDKDDLKEIIVLARNYHKNIDNIASFILDELGYMSDGTITLDEAKEKLGMPIIEPELELVTYCEQTFDPTHIFSFEYVDTNFEDLESLAVDG